MDETEEFVNCCKKLDACEAVCEIDNAILALALGKSITGYRVGEESFSLAQRSVVDLRAVRAHFKTLCDEATGVPRRLRMCHIPGASYCPVCKSNRACRCH